MTVDVSCPARAGAEKVVTAIAGLLISDQRLRAMYRGGRGDATARRLARVGARVFGWGPLPQRCVTLEVPGRRSGRVTRFPVGIAFHQGDRFLVCMLGDGCHWVCNVRAAGGFAVLRRRRSVSVQLIEVPVRERAPIIKSYLQQVPGGRPHIPVDYHQPVADFSAIAPQIPVFRIAAPPAT
jgi:hypothetical protein